MKKITGYTFIDKHENDEFKPIDAYHISSCPFCGGHPRLEKSSKTIVKGEPAKGTYVRCLSCGARGRRFLLSDDSAENHESRLWAINAWNERR